MKKLLLILISGVILMITGCSPKISVSSDYDKETDFTKFNTYSFYGWAKESDKVINEINQQRFERAVAGELKKRGLEFVENGGELILSLFIVFDQKKGVTAYTDHYRGPMGYHYGPGWGWGYGYSATTYHEYDYLVGTLVIDIFDHSRKELIWQGVGSQTVDDNPNNRDCGIKRAVKAIMTKYPVKPGKK